MNEIEELLEPFEPKLVDPLAGVPLAQVDDELMATIHQRIASLPSPVLVSSESTPCDEIDVRELPIGGRARELRVLTAAVIAVVVGLAMFAVIGTNGTETVLVADAAPTSGSDASSDMDSSTESAASAAPVTRVPVAPPLEASKATDSGRLTVRTKSLYGTEVSNSFVRFGFAGPDEQIYRASDNSVPMLDPNGEIMEWDPTVEFIEKRTVDGGWYVLVGDGRDLSWSTVGPLERQPSTQERLAALFEHISAFGVCDAQIPGLWSYCTETTDPALLSSLLLDGREIESVGHAAVRVDLDPDTELIAAIRLSGTDLQRAVPAAPFDDGHAWPLIDHFSSTIHFYDLGAEVSVEKPELGIKLEKSDFLIPTIEEGTVLVEQLDSETPSPAGIVYGPEWSEVYNAISDLTPGCDSSMTRDKNVMLDSLYSPDVTVEELRIMARQLLADGYWWTCLPPESQ